MCTKLYLLFHLKKKKLKNLILNIIFPVLFSNSISNFTSPFILIYVHASLGIIVINTRVWVESLFSHLQVARIEVQQTALFENVPFWLVHELKEEKRTLCSIVEQFINLNFDAKAKYNILWIYDFNVNTNEEKLNHFKGVFFINSKFYLVDDLMDEFWELKSDFIVNASCLIFYKVK